VHNGDLDVVLAQLHVPLSVRIAELGGALHSRQKHPFLDAQNIGIMRIRRANDVLDGAIRHHHCFPCRRPRLPATDMPVGAWADWICNGDEALLVCCSVGARITYPQ